LIDVDNSKLNKDTLGGIFLTHCPGFSWDRVNFHKQLAGLTQTVNQTGYSIPCDVRLSI